MSAAQEIAARVKAAEPGTTFIPSDFHDIASVDNAHAVLSRMAKTGDIMRAVRGVYAKPKHIEALDADVPPSPDAVAQAIARANRWRIAPSGDTALNRLGLDTQVPAVYEYVSSGPYKTYRYGKFTIEMKHRANRDLLDCSPLTCLVIQALKALGRDAADDGLALRLAGRLSKEEVIRFYEETRGSTSWVFEFAKRLRREKAG
jgi:hypothetical protein